MDIITTQLRRNLPQDLYDKVFQCTVMHLFRQCDVLRGEIAAFMNDDLRYDKMLNDFIVYQEGFSMYFERGFRYNSNCIKWGYKEEKDIDGLMALGMLRFKYLRIKRPSDFTCTYVNFSDFISYEYNEKVDDNMFYVEKSHEVVIKHYDISTIELSKLARKYPEKAFVVTYETHPFKVDRELKSFVDVTELHSNVKLKVTYFFAISATDLQFWEVNSTRFLSLFNRLYPRVDVYTCVCLYTSERYHTNLINWLDMQLEKLGYDRINQFVAYREHENDDSADIALDLRIVGKMKNLDKLTIDSKFVVNGETIGDLRGLDKLRRLKITTDGYSNKWLSTCLPEGIEQVTLFKGVNKVSQYYPVRFSDNLKCLVIKHDGNGFIYGFDTRDFHICNPRCDVLIERVPVVSRDDDNDDNDDDEDDDNDE